MERGREGGMAVRAETEEEGGRGRGKTVGNDY